ncbi:MAG: hypothetical protein ACRDT6_16870 [Micromonosporaceae bacterium]
MSDLAVVGVDPGSRWTAGVLRVGDAALWGWTLGPLNHAGTPAAIANADDVEALSRYADRIADMIERTIEYAGAAGHQRVRVAIEAARVPIGYAGGRRTRIALVDWLTPRCVGLALRGAYPDARWVLPDRHGRRPREAYPVELRGARPPHWPPCEARKGERDHERAAYDVAGVGAGLP